MANNITLPAVDSVMTTQEKADGSHLQSIVHGIFPSTNNTTTTPLGSGATYTGTGEIAPTDGVTVSCQTDNTGTLYFDFSVDGTNWSAFPTNGFAVASGIHEYHRAAVNGRYFRVRLVNDTGAQTYLRLHTYYGPHTHPSAPLNQTLGADSDAMVVRTVGSQIDLALGRLGGATEDQKFGNVDLLDAADGASDMWDYGSDDINAGGVVKTFPTVSGDLFVASDSASDTDVDLTVEYIDANGAAASVSVNTNGTTPVDLGVNGIDINRAYESGATAAVGNIYFTTANNFTAGVPNSDSEVLAFIRAGNGQTQQALYTVPAGKQAIITNVTANIQRASGAAGSAVIHMRIRESGGTWLTKRKFYPTSSVGIFKMVAGIIVPAGANIALRVMSVSDIDTSCIGEFVYLLVDA